MKSFDVKNQILDVYLSIKNSSTVDDAKVVADKHASSEKQPFSLFLRFVRKYLKFAGLYGVDPLDYLLANGDKFPALFAKFLDKYENDAVDECEQLKTYSDKYGVDVINAISVARDGELDKDSFAFWKKQTSVYLLKAHSKFDELEKISSFRKSKNTASKYDFFSKDELISNFNPEKLTKIGEDGILALCQALATAYAKEHDVAPALVTLMDYETVPGKITYGTYYAGQNKIGINAELVKKLAQTGDPYLTMKILETTFHEADHGAQYNNLGKIIARDPEGQIIADLMSITSGGDRKKMSYQEYLWQIEEMGARYSALKEINIARNKGLLHESCSGIVDNLNEQERAKNKGSARGIMKNLQHLASTTPLDDSMQYILQKRKLDAYTNPTSAEYKNLVKLLNGFEEMHYTEGVDE